MKLFEHKSLRQDKTVCWFIFHKMLAIVIVVSLSVISAAAESKVNVYLVGGPTIYEGRVQIRYNDTMGTLCDDQMTDENCVVICRQLGFSGGQSVLDAVQYYGQGSGPVWLDELRCGGTESNIDDCWHDSWGLSDCAHDEDAGCRCNSKKEEHPPAAGTCDVDRHRIRAFDPAFPGIGRVEVQAKNGTWYVICDETWDDIDATVFCQCLGYSDQLHLRAHWRKELVNMEPTLKILYDSVQCTESETETIQNIWDCQTIPSIGLCDPSTRAAGVACQALPSPTPEPEVTTSDSVTETTTTEAPRGTKRPLKFLLTTPEIVRKVASWLKINEET